MTYAAIQASALGKRYTIHGPEQRADTLRDQVVSMLKAPLRRWQRTSTDTDRNTLWALRDISFEVPQGEVVGIIGRNGAGKSTLLKILARITEPTTGYIDYFGRVGSLLEVGTGFHPELSGRENVFLNGAILGMKNGEIKHKFDDIVEFAEIGPFLDTPVKHYSSGMLVRLAFAVAAHLEPDILLVDEVLAVGDFAFQKKCLGKMNDVARGGRTVLFVSHDLGAVRTLCTQAMLLRHGQLQVQGPVDSVMDTYLEEVAGNRNTTNPAPVEDESRVRNNGELQLTQIGMQDTTGEWRQSFQIWEPFRLVFEVENLTATTKDAVCEFWVANSRGQTVGASIQYDDKDNGLTRIPGNGRATVTATCTDNGFAPGRYSITVLILGRNRHIADWSEFVLSFEIFPAFITGGAFDNRAHGAFALRSRWSVEEAEEILAE